jgi:hypothetical protein
MLVKFVFVLVIDILITKSRVELNFLKYIIEGDRTMTHQERSVLETSVPGVS